MSVVVLQGVALPAADRVAGPVVVPVVDHLV